MLLNEREGQPVSWWREQGDRVGNEVDCITLCSKDCHSWCRLTCSQHCKEIDIVGNIEKRTIELQVYKSISIVEVGKSCLKVNEIEWQRDAVGKAWYGRQDHADRLVVAHKVIWAESKKRTTTKKELHRPGSDSDDQGVITMTWRRFQRPGKGHSDLEAIPTTREGS